MFMRTSLFLVAVFTLSACTGRGFKANEFMSRTGLLCGHAYEGKIVSDDAVDDAWRAERVVMDVQCIDKNNIRIPLHVGDNRSRTWVLTQDKDVIELRHDHRHEDGSEDTLTQYGGFASENSSGSRQNFPADQSTKDLFDREGIPVSKQNTWAIEVRPTHNMFAYELSRPERFFRVEFDTSKPIDRPPPAWGDE